MAGALDLLPGIAWFGIMILVIIVFYVYTALALQTIARKLNHKYPWLAWIPGANIALIFQLGGFPWPLVFLLLIPLVGALAVLVLSVISLWRIYEKRNYPGWLALIMLGGIIPFLGILATIAHLVAIGFVAWKDR